MTPEPLAERILVLTPTGRDGPMIARVLGRSGMAAEVCGDMGEFCRRWEEGAGAAVIAEEALAPKNRESLVESLARQPVWSDFPLVILTGGGHTTRASEAVAQALEARGNVTLLERPLRMLTLVSAMHAALRARRRQYEVKRLLEETRRAVEERDEFLAMLAHELRNPLAPVRNSLEVLKRAEGDGELSRQARTTMERQVGHMVKLIDDLLEVSRISRGKIKLRREAVELASVLYHAVEQARPHAERAGHDLAVTTPNEPVYLDADPVRLAQVFSNLLNNACKFTQAGGRIRLTAERQGSDVVVRVKDTGVGIPPDKLASIFEMFTQVDQSLERTQGGLGIGLTLVKRLVEMHGGSVEARSEGAGKGSEFVVRLPVHLEAGSRQTQEPTGSEGRTPAAARRFLVADDNRDAADSLALLLRLAGHEVHTAYDGQEAVEKAAGLLPDVILLDLGMPRLNGYDAARRIREQPWGRGVVLVALTGWGQDDDRRKSKEAGFDGHLVKPVDPNQLQELLARSGSLN